jgi:NADH-quinone oxidoreductase subunit J
LVFEQILFFLAAGGAIAGALGVILVRNPFYSVLALIVHLLALAILFLLLRAEFLAAAQIVVYAGAIMVMYVFVVAYIGGVHEEDTGGARAATRLGPVFAALLLAELTIAVTGSGLGALDTRGADLGPGFGSPGAIGELLLEKFLLGFELASLLLTATLVGAVVLARRRHGLEELDAVPVPERTGEYPLGRGEDDRGPDDPDATRVPAGTAEAPGDPTVEHSR